MVTITDASNEIEEGWDELMGNDLIMKSLNGSSLDETAASVQPQDMVMVDFVGRYAQDCKEVDGPIFQEANDWVVVIGNKYVCPALEMCIRFMKVGEKALVWSHSKFALGFSTRKYDDYELAPNSNVVFEVHVKKIISETDVSTASLTVQLGMSRKVIANDIFKNEGGEMSSKRALILYSGAAQDLVKFLQDSTDEEGDDSEEDKTKLRQEASEIMLDCLNNIVAVHLRAKNYHQAKEAAIQVLRQHPRNYKALIRAAKAAMYDPAGSFEEADAAISAAEEVKGDDSDVKKLRAELQRNKQEYRKKKKLMMDRMQKGMTAESDGAKESSSADQIPENEPVPTISEDASATTTTTTTTEETGKPFDWRSKIIPYGFQLLLPFIMYFLAMANRRTPENSPIVTSSEDEF